MSQDKAKVSLHVDLSENSHLPGPPPTLIIFFNFRDIVPLNLYFVTNMNDFDQIALIHRLGCWQCYSFISRGKAHLICELFKSIYWKLLLINIMKLHGTYQCQV